MALTGEGGKRLQYPLTIKGKVYIDHGAYELEQELQTAEQQYIARD